MARADDYGDTFAPALNDPRYNDWYARNRFLTREMVEQTRMPNPYVRQKEPIDTLNAYSFGDDPFLVAGSMMLGLNPDRKANLTAKDFGADPRGYVDPDALRVLAQGGPYDIEGRRAAIAKRLLDNQLAALPPGAAPRDSGMPDYGISGGPSIMDYKMGNTPGTGAGDMAVSGATPGAVTQQGFFSTAVPSREFDDGKPTPFTQRDDDEAQPGFDEDAANQAIADMLAEAIANTPADVPESEDPSPNAVDKAALNENSNQAIADMLAEAIAAHAPTPSSHQSGRNADVVAPTPSGYPGEHSDIPGATPSASLGLPGPGALFGGSYGTPAPSSPTPGNFGFTANPPGGYPGEHGDIPEGAPDTFGSRASAMPEGFDPQPDFPGGVPTPTPAPDRAFAHDLFDPGTGLPAGGRAGNTSSQTGNTMAAGHAAAAAAAAGRGGFSGAATGPITGNAVTTGGIPGYNPGDFADVVAEGDKEGEGGGKSGRDAISEALADFADMGALASQGMPAAPGFTANDYSDFASGKSSDAAIAAAMASAPSFSGPITGSAVTTGGIPGFEGGTFSGPTEPGLGDLGIAEMSGPGFGGGAVDGTGGLGLGGLGGIDTSGIGGTGTGGVDTTGGLGSGAEPGGADPSGPGTGPGDPGGDPGGSNPGGTDPSGPGTDPGSGPGSGPGGQGGTEASGAGMGSDY